ncbi:GntR family transcriptional regulator [Paralcaligenes sp. KSB-10]|uniref:GntR family transcriptional regulator n=1 Tax=Paralcaligenes sp. KSB-10 TaxID=2901142 RepID=UPI001E290D37|nr:GntR family transcriptional regulator [Paralcaligenes sp. KSB-10]UHL62941.1 GntR family transcriptional regulator [Paralcaligenes sp. KSB-10]
MREYAPSSSVGLTLYKLVKRQMLAGLSAGEWKPGEVIPAEKQLSQRFDVSIGTLRKAIDELVAENILIRHQGRGTFVAMHSREQHLFHFFNVVRHDGLKAPPDVALVQFAKTRADKKTCEKLGIASSAKVFKLTNVLRLNNAPVQVDEITVPEALFAGLSESQLRNRPSTLYSLYQEAFGLNVIRIDERVRATPADEEQARLLGIAPGTALLQIHRIAFSYNNQPIECRVSYLDTRHYEYCPRVAQ